jgi:large subunit ribosomal protein L4
MKKYNLEGKETGSVKAEKYKSLQDKKAHSQMIKDYIVAIRANARQWSANTKGRSEVAHTTKKPHKQKGTGRARQGSLVSPQFRGGGIVFGPKPKFDQHVKINKKEKKAVIHAMLAEKIANDSLIIVEDFDLEEPKTKKVGEFLKKAGISKRVLFLGEGNYAEVETEGKKAKVNVKCDKHVNFTKSLRNIPKTSFALAKNINGYDLMLADKIVLTEAALDELTEWLA